MNIFTNDNKNINKEEKDEKKIEKNIIVVPRNPIWKYIVMFLILATIISVIVCIVPSIIDMSKLLPFLYSLENKKLILNKLLLTSTITTTAVSLILIFFIFILRLRKPKFDSWVSTIAYKRLSTEKIYFKGKKLYVTYDVALNKKDINEFISEISDKSNKFSYFLDKIYIDKYLFSMTINKKQEIPKRCSIDVSQDKIWNFIPMGKAININTKKVSDIGWYLNDNNTNPENIETLPSTSLLIAGGTGSGKSVVENGIIGHITRYPDNIQGLLADVKKVEFGGLDDFKGIKCIALSVAEVEEELTQAREIMMNRFEFMEHNHVNNVYKLKTEVDYFIINGKSYQFDEIFTCKINGKKQLLTLDKIYQNICDGKEVEIDDKFLI